MHYNYTNTHISRWADINGTGLRAPSSGTHTSLNIIYTINTINNTHMRCTTDTSWQIGPHSTIGTSTSTLHLINKNQRQYTLT